jgi:hypothetical protein
MRRPAQPQRTPFLNLVFRFKSGVSHVSATLREITPGSSFSALTHGQKSRWYSMFHCQNGHDPLELISNTLAAVGCRCDGGPDHCALSCEDSNLAAGSCDASDFRARSRGHMVGKSPVPQGSGHRRCHACGRRGFGLRRLGRFHAVGSGHRCASRVYNKHPGEDSIFPTTADNRLQ